MNISESQKPFSAIVVDGTSLLNAVACILHPGVKPSGRNSFLLWMGLVPCPAPSLDEYFVELAPFPATITRVQNVGLWDVQLR